MGSAWSVYTNASQMERLTPGGPSKWTLTKAPETQELEFNTRALLVASFISSALTWHGRVTGQEQRPALLEDPCKPITDRVNAEVWPIIADTDHDGRLTSLG